MYGSFLYAQKYCTEITEYAQLPAFPAQNFVISTFIVVPVGQVDRAFAAGWRKVPTELKVKVLSDNLVYDEWIHGAAFVSGK